MTKLITESAYNSSALDNHLARHSTCHVSYIWWVELLWRYHYNKSTCQINANIRTHSSQLVGDRCAPHFACRLSLNLTLIIMGCSLQVAISYGFGSVKWGEDPYNAVYVPDGLFTLEEDESQ